VNDLVIQPGEKVLEEDFDVVWLRGWWRKPRGRLIFTTQRLVFQIPKPAGYTTTSTLSRELTNWTPVDIPRDALHGIEQARHKHEMALVVKTEYETHKFFVRDCDGWEKRLKQAMHDDGVAMQNLLDRLKPKDIPPPYR